MPVDQKRRAKNIRLFSIPCTWDYACQNLRNKGEKVSEEAISDRKAADKQLRMFAKFGNGRWYAILPEMEASFRKAGADVSTLAVETADVEPHH